MTCSKICLKLYCVWHSIYFADGGCISFLGEFGGIFEAPRRYFLASNNSDEAHVKIVEEFSYGKVGNKSIGLRVPWLRGAKLTTDEGRYDENWGTLTSTYHD